MLITFALVCRWQKGVDLIIVTHQEVEVTESGDGAFCLTCLFCRTGQWCRSEAPRREQFDAHRSNDILG
jgi:hypothetical protein